MEDRKRELLQRIEQSPTSENLLELGELELSERELEGALVHILACLSIDSQNHLARLRLAQTFIELKFTGFAVRELEQLIQDNPQNTFLKKILLQLAPESSLDTPSSSGSTTIRREQISPEETVAEAEFDFEALEVLGSKKPD